jgi:hypothetical protein
MLKTWWTDNVRQVAVYLAFHACPESKLSMSPSSSVDDMPRPTSEIQFARRLNYGINIIRETAIGVMDTQCWRTTIHDTL